MPKNTHSARQDETFIYTVGLPLTNDELLKRGSDAASLKVELDALEANFTTQKEQYKAAVSANTAQRDALMHEIHTKKAYVAIECYNDFNHESRRCSIRRTDTNEEVDWRQMTKEELERPALEFEKRRRATMRLATDVESIDQPEASEDEQAIEKAA